MIVVVVVSKNITVANLYLFYIVKGYRSLIDSLSVGFGWLLSQSNKAVYTIYGMHCS